jgi:hypothetical protein
MTLWTSKSYRKQGYVKISPGKGLEDSLISEGSSPIALYYVPSTRLLTVSLSEEMIKRAIDRNILKREQNASKIKASWSGMSTSLVTSNPIPYLFDLSAGQQIVKKLQKKSWGNIYPLNEWHTLLKKKDPLAYHQEIWHTELLCPGGGKYQWNEDFKTYESTVFGHPGEPKSPNNISVLGDWQKVGFGIKFEKDGIRVQAHLHRKKPTL